MREPATSQGRVNSVLPGPYLGYMPSGTRLLPVQHMAAPGAVAFSEGSRAWMAPPVLERLCPHWTPYSPTHDPGTAESRARSLCSPGSFSSQVLNPYTWSTYLHICTKCLYIFCFNLYGHALIWFWASNSDSFWQISFSYILSFGLYNILWENSSHTIKKSRGAVTWTHVMGEGAKHRVRVPQAGWGSQRADEGPIGVFWYWRLSIL